MSQVLHIEDEYVGRPLCGTAHTYPLSTVRVNDLHDLEERRKKEAQGYTPLCRRCAAVLIKALTS